MSETETVEKAHVEEIAEEPRLPGHETRLDPKPDWEPRYPGSGRQKGKVAIVTEVQLTIAAPFLRCGRAAWTR